MDRIEWTYMLQRITPSRWQKLHLVQSDKTVGQKRMSPDEKRILDMLYIAPYDSKGTKGWLVRFKWYPNGKPTWHSKLVSWSEARNPNQALDEARRYRDEWIAKNKDKLWLRGGGSFNAELPANNTSGILGVNRPVRVLPSGTVSEEWQTTWLKPDGSDGTKRASTRKFGEIEALCMVVEARRDGLKELQSIDKWKDDPSLDSLIDYYDDIIEHLLDLKNQSPGRPILEIVRDPNISGTSKFEEIQLRIGQQRFRRSVPQIFDMKCAVSGSSVLVRASHIKPWRVASDPERLDPMNGLALSPNYDAAFDIGLITFRSDGAIMIAREFADDARKLGISENDRLLVVMDAHASYLDWHRKNVFGRRANQSPATVFTKQA